MTGNRHSIWRCDTCEFWARGDQWGEECDKNRNRDDRIGSCHRNAARPTVGDYEYQTLHFLSLIAWAIEHKPDQKDFNDWEEACLHTSIWPSTSGSDWCGEWQKLEHGSKGMD
jgi:hypothetical protein